MADKTPSPDRPHRSGLPRITITRLPDGRQAVIVTGPLTDGDADWWTHAARSKVWTVEPSTTPNGRRWLHATRICRHGAQAHAAAERARRQLDRSLDRLYLSSVPTTTPSQEKQ